MGPPEGRKFWGVESVSRGRPGGTMAVMVLPVFCKETEPPEPGWNCWMRVSSRPVSDLTLYSMVLEKLTWRLDTFSIRMETISVLRSFSKKKSSELGMQMQM